MRKTETLREGAAVLHAELLLREAKALLAIAEALKGAARFLVDKADEIMMKHFGR